MKTTLWVTAFGLASVLVATSADVASQNVKNAQPPPKLAVPVKLVKIVPRETTAIGMGYAVDIDSMRSLAVQGPETLNKIGTQEGQSNTIDTTLEYIHSYSDLARHLDASASGGYAGYSASARMMQSSRVTRTESHVLVRLVMASHKTWIESATLNRNALRVAKTSNQDFYGNYGDSYVSAIIYGGELVAFLTFSDLTTQQQKDLEVSVSGPAAKASFRETISSITRNRNVRIKYAQAGGRIGNPAQPGAGDNIVSGGVITLTAEQLLQRLNLFPAEVRDFPNLAEPLEAELKDYTTVSNWPKGVTRPTAGRRDPRSPALKRVEVSLRDLREKLDVLGANQLAQADLLAGIRMRQQYIDHSLGQLDSIRERIADSRNSSEANVWLYRYEQYATERSLGFSVSQLVRVNAGKQCDPTDADTARVIECLIGPAAFFDASTWPSIQSITSTRASTGENREWMRGTPYEYSGDMYFGRERGIQSPDFNLTQKVCGSSTASVLVIPNIVRFASKPGNCCGYATYTVSCVSINRPHESLVQAIAKPTQIKASVAPEVKIGDGVGGHAIRFNVFTPCKGQSYGKYRVTFINASGKPTIEESYWLINGEGPVPIEHPIPNVKNQRASAQVDEAFCHGTVTAV